MAGLQQLPLLGEPAMLGWPAWLRWLLSRTRGPEWQADSYGCCGHSSVLGCAVAKAVWRVEG
eukprot:6962232-Alexandrium_andersonii.AAC.1